LIRNLPRSLHFHVYLSLLPRYSAPNPHVGVINRIVWHGASNRKCRLRHCGNRLLPMRAAMNERAGEQARFMAARSAPGIRQNRMRSFVLLDAIRNPPPSLNKYAKSRSSHAHPFSSYLSFSLSLSLSHFFFLVVYYYRWWNIVSMDSHDPLCDVQFS